MKFNLVNTTKALFFIALSFVFISFNNKTTSSLNFDKGKKQISKQNIIGEGTQQILVDQKTLNKAHVSEITLAPNSYTHWHSHPGGQIMVVTDGEGVYQSKGKSKVKIKKGDVIETMDGLYHWNGSAPNSSLSYISIKIVKEKVPREYTPLAWCKCRLQICSGSDNRKGKRRNDMVRGCNR